MPPPHQPPRPTSTRPQPAALDRPFYRRVKVIDWQAAYFEGDRWHWVFREIEPASPSSPREAS